MRRFDAKVLRQVRRRGDDIMGCRVLVACSGGGDSVALLACLSALRVNLKINLAVAHVNHGLRQEAQEDAEFVAELCERYGLSFSVALMDVAGHASSSRLGLETAARELRWAWLKAEASKNGASWIATGHTIEDHTETVFLRLARGAGLGCLTGLPAVQAPRWSPLVECRREELRAYLHAMGIGWRDDVTNEDGFTPRNRWRRHLASFRDEAPCIDRHLWETHRQAADLMELRDALVLSWKGSRWGITDNRHIVLGFGWNERDLAWAIEAAFQELGLARDPAHIFDLASWAATVLSRPLKRSWRWGNWSLCPHPEGALLQIDSPQNP